MLFVCWIIACLLSKTVITTTCSLMFSSHTAINITSKVTRTANMYECQYFFEMPDNHKIILNFTKLYGFTLTTSQHSPIEKSSPSIGMSDNIREIYGSYSTHRDQSAASPADSQQVDFNVGRRRHIYDFDDANNSTNRQDVTSYRDTDMMKIRNKLQIVKSRNKSRRHCFPEIIISEVIVHKPRILQRINCNISNASLHGEFVVMSSHSISIIYRWLEGDESGFRLNINIITPYDKHICQFTCADSTCQQTNSVKCNVFHDCSSIHPDTCLITTQSTNSPIASNESIQISVICIAVLLSVMLIVCVVTRQYCTRSSRERHSSQTSERACLQPPSQQSSTSGPCTEVVYLPTTLSEPSSMSSTTLSSRNDLGSQNYPPNIPISRDGEEGHAYHQLSLNGRHGNTADSVCVPPNCTVYDLSPQYDTSIRPYLTSMIRDYDLWPYGRSLSFGNAVESSKTHRHCSAHIKSHHASSVITGNGTRKTNSKGSSSCDKNCQNRERHVPRLLPQFCRRSPTDTDSHSSTANILQGSRQQCEAGVVDRSVQTHQPPDTGQHASTHK